MTTSDSLPRANRRLRLGIEFALLYVGAPLAIALFLPPRQMFSALFLLTLAGLVLLHCTGGFDWRSLLRGWRQIPWREAAVLAAVTLVSGIVILWLSGRQDAIFNILRVQPEMLLMIWALYPLLSALPQELIFRPLFYHRYGSLFASRKQALMVNAAVFSFAHLMYWSAIVLLMTFVGGWIFGRAYLKHGFPAAWLLHAIAGNIIFAVGMGVYFWSGNVQRPF
ncbi:MAG: CPBP family intramembrane metalloprotease [Paracoccus sp. (in: a-proteobacteria)]|uniref:CPBP family glutamic-type intramembrane protease n=1 Tax=Paracoccus sp. TaxID=267 RepID=UPI0026DF2405|nr:CPBP family intramembrane glutamic endopeptidase [Paracoccus sp. (in: a-proteobacteria)]MDO5632107.1 CPBP family intramembrane metalloprotease [Paracoccus sp. (in: a-proteobacteria)]